MSAAAGAVTLLSGFGLGTVLMPVFALFFPVEAAIVATGVVHLVNNLFKLGLVGRHAVRAVVIAFGVPALLAAMAGAALLTRLAVMEPLHAYTLVGLEARMTWVKVITGALLAVLATLETLPAYRRMSFGAGALPLGGVLSGFLGGLSGMQGALRAPFLLRLGLERHAYVGSANVISAMVDVARLAAYAVGLGWLASTVETPVWLHGRTAWLVATACIAGCLGSLVGARILKGVSMRSIRTLVAAMLLLAAAAMVAGVI